MDETNPRPAAGPSRPVAVLGGSGFVGRPVCRALGNLGYEVVALARRERPVPGAARVRAVDLTSASVDEIAEIFRAERIGAVVNAAGGMWGLTDEEMVAANVTLVERVIEAAATAQAPVRLVQLSSVHEYGLVPIGTSMAEDMVPAPVTEYGRLKLRCTESVSEATRQGLIDGVCLRIGNVVGAGQPRVSLLGVVAEQLWQARAEGRGAVLRLGPLGSQRDFIDLTDAVEAIVAVVTLPRLPGDVFNIGTGRATSARTMVRSLIETSGVPTELIEAEPSGPAETTWQQMRIDRARRLLGWAPTGDLASGVKALWEHRAEAND